MFNPVTPCLVLMGWPKAACLDFLGTRKKLSETLPTNTLIITKKLILDTVMVVDTHLRDTSWPIRRLPKLRRMSQTGRDTDKNL